MNFFYIYKNQIKQKIITRDIQNQIKNPKKIIKFILFLLEDLHSFYLGPISYTILKPIKIHFSSNQESLISFI
jgi:hypothetical protein